MNPIFISYSHKDEDWKDRLVTHLGVLQEQDLLEIWEDRQIAAGDDWYREIETALNAADVAILLISANFLTSDFILKEEIPPLLERRANEGLRVIPLIVKPCAWTKINWLSPIQARPKDGRALSSGEEAQIDADLAALAQEVADLLNRADSSTPPITDERVSQVPVMSSTTAQINTVNPNSHLHIGLPDLKLGEEVKIPIKGKVYMLGDLVQALIEHDSTDLEFPFDERGQLEIGQYLYAQLVENLVQDERERLRDANEVEVRIITQDEHIARLPWVLLAHNGIFLSPTGWAVAISSKTEAVDCELPPSPRTLVVAPQPVGVERTRAESHLEELENELSARDHLLSEGCHLRIVYTWEDFTQAVQEFEPQVVYYYGHGMGNVHKTKLVFAAGKNQKRQDVPIADFALHLRNMEVSPRLVYVNCCLGDAGGFLGAGRQLEDFVPAVITNRTVASIDAAQSQAMALWESILLKGVAPHKAVASLYSRMGDLDLSTADLRWMTPVLHCHYANWRANPPTPPGRTVHDPYWHLKIDRVTQFSTVATQTRQMLREWKPRSLAFVWYGRQGEGIEIFHQRLNVELREDLSNTFVYEVRPDWPAELHNVDRSFRDMLTEAFEVNELADIPARIRSRTHGAFGKQTLVYVRHQPVTSPKLINPKTLKAYLQWWDTAFVPLLEPHQFALLGVSFEVKNPPRFQTLLLDRERLEDLDLQEMVFRLLDEMEVVARRDLLDFLRTHKIRLPIDRRVGMMERILEKTGGHYESTVEALKNVVEEAWNLTDEGAQTTEQSDEEVYDY